MSSASHPARVFRFAAFEVNIATGELRKDGIQLRIQDQPLRLLATLLARPGELVTREHLRNELWSETYVEFDTALNSTVKRLRTVLNDSAENPRFIQTVGSRGYRFIYPVEPFSPGDGKVNSGNSPSPLPQSALRFGAVRASRWLRSSNALPAGFAASILIAIFAYAWVARSRHMAPTNIRSLAVLPLESLSSDPSQSYFADGLTDQLITDLGQVASVRVISRTSIMQYKGTHKPLLQIAHDLNVDAVVEGTILRSGNRVRITAQLIQATADRHLWAESYDGDLTDVLSLQEQVADDIANHIQAHLPANQQEERKNSPRHINSEAYDAYLQARYFEEQHNPEGLQEAIKFFKEALQKDPKYALAYLGLARSYHELSYRDVLPPGKATQLAREAAQKALLLDDSSAEAHTALAKLKWTSFEWGGARTELELQRAIQLNPSYAPAHDIHAWVLSAEGRADPAVGEAKRALELDPLGVLAHSHLGDAYYYAHRYTEAIPEYRRALELHPTAAEPIQDLTVTFLLSRRPADFLAEAEHWMNVSNEQFSRQAAAELHALKRTDSQRGIGVLIEQALAQRKIAYASSAWIAILCIQNHDADQALGWLATAYEERDPGFLYIGVEPAFSDLRSDPRFQRLVAQLH